MKTIVLPLALLLMLLLMMAGCNQPAAAPPAAQAAEGQGGVTVSVIKPERKTVRRTIEQPGHVEAFEQAPLHVKIPGYVRKVHVDIGDHVEKDQVLAELSVPEMVEERNQKEALVEQAKAEVGQMLAALDAAKANHETTKAGIQEASAGRRRVEANFERWQSEYKRVDKLVVGKVIDEQTRDEILNQFKAAEASVEEVDARVRSAMAASDESFARQKKVVADLEAARARQKVAEADYRRLEALLEYARIKAPFKGTITRRHIDTGHFLQPASTSSAEPLFLLARSDSVRIFVEVPESEAALVDKGMPIRLRAQALKGQEFAGKVSRTSWALDPKSHTLRTEIVLENKEGQLRPGMYVNVTLIAEKPNALTLPALALVVQGDQTFCFRFENGKALRTPIQVGLSGGGLVEVLKKQTSSGQWDDFTGSEQIISSNAASLTDGQMVSAGTK